MNQVAVRAFRAKAEGIVDADFVCHVLGKELTRVVILVKDALLAKPALVIRALFLPHHVSIVPAMGFRSTSS